MLYPRNITKDIKKWLLKKEIIVLNGARQVGKTFLLKILHNELIKLNIPKQTIFYLNLEDIKILESLNQAPNNLLLYIKDKTKKNYFLLDEIQYLDNPSNFLKYLYDEYQDKIKIIATGSSSLEIKAKFQDSLAGRKVSFIINPLNFKEFLWFKKFKYFDYLENKKLPPAIKQEFDMALEEYLIYGGMPAVVLQKDYKLKEKLLIEYISTYVNKDIRSIGKIENILHFNNLIKILSSQIGNLLNINELSNTANIARRTVEEYLDLLEFTFVLNKIFPFQANIRSQITKMPKIYFFDIGIRNGLLGNFLNIASRSDAGALFENFIFLEIVNQINLNQIFFYRTVNKSEIDFIVEKNTKINLIEAKYQRLNKRIDARHIKTFIRKNKNTVQSFIVNLEYNFQDGLIKYIDYRLLASTLNALQSAN